MGPVLLPGLPFAKFAQSGINLHADDWGVTRETVACEILERKEGRWKARQVVSTVIRPVVFMAVNKGLCASALVPALS